MGFMFVAVTTRSGVAGPIAHRKGPWLGAEAGGRAVSESGPGEELYGGSLPPVGNQHRDLHPVSLSAVTCGRDRRWGRRSSRPAQPGGAAGACGAMSCKGGVPPWPALGAPALRGVSRQQAGFCVWPHRVGPAVWPQVLVGKVQNQVGFGSGVWSWFCWTQDAHVVRSEGPAGGWGLRSKASRENLQWDSRVTRR